MVGTYRQLVRSGLLIASLLVAACVAGCGMQGQSTQATQTTHDPAELVTLTVVAPKYSTSDIITYNPSDTIVVNLFNGSKKTIYFPDHQTNCTVIMLQVQPEVQIVGSPGNAAEAAATATATSIPQLAQNCAVYTASTLYSLRPLQAKQVQLPPEDGFWQMGTYRAVLTYTSAPGEPPITISSPLFQVTGQPGGSIFPGPQATATTGPVTLTIGPPPPPYSPNDTITVTLTNSGNQTIYYFNNYTDCSIVLLQWEVGTNSWNPVENCQPGKTLDPQQPLPTDKSVTITLKPQTGPWQTGIYRAALLYSFSPNLPPSTQIYSAGFEVAESQGS
jgi:hypothetical protein